MKYSLRNAAKMLGIKVRTARAWVHTGYMQAEKDPVTHRWSVDDVEIERIRKERGIYESE